MVEPQSCERSVAKNREIHKKTLWKHVDTNKNCSFGVLGTILIILDSHVVCRVVLWCVGLSPLLDSTTTDPTEQGLYKPTNFRKFKFCPPFCGRSTRNKWVFPKIGVLQNGWFISWKTLWKFMIWKKNIFLVWHPNLFEAFQTWETKHPNCATRKSHAEWHEFRKPARDWNSGNWIELKQDCRTTMKHLRVIL